MNKDEIKKLVDEVRKNPDVADQEVAYNGKKATTRVSGSFSAVSASAVGYSLGVNGFNVTLNAAQTTLAALLSAASGASATSVANKSGMISSCTKIESTKKTLGAIFGALVSVDNWCAAFKKPSFAMRARLHSLDVENL